MRETHLGHLGLLQVLTDSAVGEEDARQCAGSVSAVQRLHRCSV